jgi:hypothetical protein
MEGEDEVNQGAILRAIVMPWGFFFPRAIGSISTRRKENDAIRKGSKGRAYG